MSYDLANSAVNLVLLNLTVGGRLAINKPKASLMFTRDFSDLTKDLFILG